MFSFPRIIDMGDKTVERATKHMIQKNCKGDRMKEDINIDQQYRLIKAEFNRIDTRQNELLEKHAGDLSPVQSELNTNLCRLKELKQAAFALIPFDAVAFEKYAATLFQNMQTVIINDADLTAGVINYTKMDVVARTAFGTRLYQKMAQKYGATNYTEMKFVIEDLGDLGGGYDWDKTISIDPTELTDFAGFISVFVHEFSHYIYIKFPHKSPMTEQMVKIACEMYIGGPVLTPQRLERYKNQPFELPSYKMMDYFATHDFIGKLTTAIKIKQNALSRGME